MNTKQSSLERESAAETAPNTSLPSNGIPQRTSGATAYLNNTTTAALKAPFLLLRRIIERALHDEDIVLFLLAGRWFGLIPPAIALLGESQLSSLPAILLGTACIVNLVLSLWHAKFDRWLLRQPLLLSLDILIAGIILMLSGGSRSPYFFYALIPVLAASFFFSPRAGWFAALAFTPMYAMAVLWPLRYHEPINLVAITVQLLSFYGLAIIFGYQSVLVGRLQKAYDDLHRSQDEAAKIQTLAAMGKVVAHISHEIRNPLTTIGGYASRLVLKPEDAEAVKSYAEIITSEATRLEKLLNDILTLARPHEAKLTEGNVHQVLDRACLLVSGDLDELGILLRKNYSSGLPSVPMSQASLLRAFLNIIHNAIQALPQGGTLDIKTQQREGSVVVTISDDGPGISPDILSTLWTPFKTNREHGTGLGLAIVKQIIKQHGGRVTAENKVLPEHGARFIFTLPLKPESPDSPMSYP